MVKLSPIYVHDVPHDVIQIFGVYISSNYMYLCLSKTYNKHKYVLITLIYYKQ